MARGTTKLTLILALTASTALTTGCGDQGSKGKKAATAQSNLVQTAKTAYNRCVSSLRQYQMDGYCESVGSELGIGSACSVLYFAYGLCGANGLSPEVYSQDQLTAAQYEIARNYYFSSYLPQATQADIQLMIRTWNNYSQGYFQ